MTVDGVDAARQMFADDAVVAALGIELVDVGTGRATVRMTVRHDMLNGFGTIHGGVLFTFADSALSLASNSRGATTVAAAASIEFLGPAREGDVLVADAVERFRQRRTGVYDVVVTAPGGETIAHFRGRSHTLA